MEWSFLKKCGLLSLPILFITSVDGNAFSSVSQSYVTIRADRGGQIINYALKMMKLRDAGRNVRFAGSCDSACTLFLALPSRQVCISSGASFGFHLPYGASGRGNKVAANYLLRSYPGWVKTWISNNGGLSAQIKTMNYSYARKYLSLCPDIIQRKPNTDQPIWRMAPRTR